MTAKKIALGLLILVAGLFLFRYAVHKGNSNKETAGTATMSVTSTAFDEGGFIPKDYTCDGSNISPPLAWTGVPDGTECLALICDDPDAPGGTWTHWVLFNLPATVSELPGNMQSVKVLENGARHGINDFKKIGYGGPCPPAGTHRYYFRLYALDTHLNQEAGITRAELIKAMKSHILAEGQLMGRYKRL